MSSPITIPLADLPGERFVPDYLNPQPFGLYAAATVLESQTRLQFGVDWWPRNCGPSGVWVPDVCPDPDTLDRKTGDRPENVEFPPATVWATDECGLFEPVDGMRDRAVQLLRLKEPIHVEEHTATLLLQRDTPLPPAASLVEAVGALEESLGGTLGFSGVIHARRGLAAQLAAARLVERQGTQLVTPLGNRWVFGGGYGLLGNTMVATGPVTVMRDDVTTRTAVDHTINEQQVVAERTVVVGWECPAFAASATWGA